MTEKIINTTHTAVGSMAGYLFQTDRALVLLCSCNNDESVSIELVDDVAKMDDNEKVVYREQDKSSISQTNQIFRDKSKDLWNTLMIWVTGIKNGTLDIHTTKLVCVANTKIKENSLIHKISQAESDKEVEAIIKLLRSTGRNPRVDMERIVSTVLKNEEILKVLIPKISLLHSNSFEDRNSEIANRLNLTDETKGNIIEVLRGWLNTTILRQIEQGTAPIIRKSDFNERFLKASRKENLDSFLNYFKNIESAETKYRINYFNLKGLDLLYFTIEENLARDKIVTRLNLDRVCLLFGDAATGKTITTFRIAETLKDNNYKVFYLKLSETYPTPNDIINEVKYHLDQKNAFILEDVHLNPETAWHFYTYFKEHNLSAVLLLTSRKTSKSLGLEEYSLDELEEEAFVMRRETIQAKCLGILYKYQAYYRNQSQNTLSYRIGDETIIKNSKTYHNLIFFKALIEAWEHLPDQDFSSISLEIAYKYVYKIYFEKAINTTESKIRIAAFAFLYLFEIPFEIPEPWEASIVNLSQKSKSLILNGHSPFFVFDHPEMARLLHDSFIYCASKIIESKVSRLADFSAYLLEIYLLELNERSPQKLRPINFESLLSTLFTGKHDLQVSKDLFNSPSLLKQIKILILKSGDEGLAYSFFATISNHKNDQAVNFFNWINANGWSKAAETHKRLFCNIVAILSHNKENGIINLALTERFSADILLPSCFDEQIQNLSESLHILKIINPMFCRAILAGLKKSDAIAKLKRKCLEAGFHGLAFGLHTLQGVDPDLARKLITDLYNDEKAIELLAKKSLDNSLRGLGQVLNILNNTNPTLVEKIESHLIGSDHYIEDISSECLEIAFDGLGQVLINLHEGSPLLANRIVEKLYNREKIDKLLSKSFKGSFMGLASGLNNIYKANKLLAEKLAIEYMKTENMDLLKHKFSDSTFDGIGQAMSNINNVSRDLVVEICENVALNNSSTILKTLLENANFEAIGQGLSNLVKAGIPFVLEIIKLLEDEKGIVLLTQKALGSTLKGLGQGLNNLHSADAKLSKKISREICKDDTAFENLVAKSQAEQLEEIAQGLRNMSKNHRDLAAKIALHFLGHIDILIAKCVNIRFSGLYQSLQNLYYADTILFESLCHKLLEVQNFDKIISNEILVKTNFLTYHIELKGLMTLNFKLAQKVFINSPLTKTTVLDNCLALSCEPFLRAIQPFCQLNPELGRLILVQYGIEKLCNEVNQSKKEKLIDLLSTAVKYSDFSVLERSHIISLIGL